MLDYLKIKNVALIEELEISFGVGLNILSGETGAGKSIIIDSINFALGERMGREFIRSGESSASVEALISVSNGARGDETIELLNSLGVSVDDDRSLLLFRSISDSAKNVCKINGRVITVGMLKEISAHLVDIHGQHEHQSLLSPNRHIELLDRFCGTELSETLDKLSILFKQYRETVKQIKSVSGTDLDMEYKTDLYRHQINEIESAKLKKNEEDLLLERRKLLNNSEKLTAAASSAVRFLNGAETGSGESGAVEKLSKAVEHIGIIAELDNGQRAFYELVASLCEQLDDSVRDFIKYYEGLEHDPNELNKIEERLDLIYRLKKKYGRSVEEILEFLDAAKTKLGLITNSEEEVNRLTEQKKKLEREIAVLCAAASKIRRQAAQKLQDEIAGVLRDLGMKNACFEISVERKTDFSAAGFDKIEFMISPNKGEPMKPLSKIASGGEMSRVMLALKTALAEYDNIETFIFDEIDTGVSGRTAQQVAEKLKKTACSHQILCITHLPQIAAMADSHFLIIKKTIGDKTFTTVNELDEAESVNELARLIGGAKITETTVGSAREMRQFGKNIK